MEEKEKDLKLECIREAVRATQHLLFTDEDGLNLEEHQKAVISMAEKMYKFITNK